MNKNDIIQQWNEDQKEVDFEALNWIWRDGDSYEIDQGKYYFQLDVEFDDEIIIMCNDSLVFVGDVSNQGELRILMKMLNIK